MAETKIKTVFDTFRERKPLECLDKDGCMIACIDSGGDLALDASYLDNVEDLTTLRDFLNKLLEPAK